MKVNQHEDNRLGNYEILNEFILYLTDLILIMIYINLI